MGITESCPIALQSLMAYKLGRRKVIVRRQFNYELYTLLQLKNYNDDKMRANGENMGGREQMGRSKKELRF